MGQRLAALVAAVVLGTGALVTSSANVADAAATPEVTVGDVAIVEGDAGRSVVKIPVDLSVPSTTTVTVPFTVRPEADGVTDSSDAVVTQGKLTFAAGVVSKPVSVAVTGDGTPEPDQHFAVTLGTPIGAAVADGSGEVTIRDDDANGVDPGVTVSIGDVMVHEAEPGPTLPISP